MSLKPANQQPVKREARAPDEAQADTDPEGDGRPVKQPNQQQNRTEAAGDRPGEVKPPVRPRRMLIPRPHFPECR